MINNKKKKSIHMDTKKCVTKETKATKATKVKAKRRESDNGRIAETD